jgi:hypothetical protein
MAKYYKRQFLNAEDDGGVAFIEFQVDETTRARCRKGCGVSTKFQISDCNRIINLDFGCYHKGSIDKVRAKFNRLRRAILAFGVALNDELDRYEEIGE